MAMKTDYTALYLSLFGLGLAVVVGLCGCATRSTAPVSPPLPVGVQTTSHSGATLPPLIITNIVKLIWNGSVGYGYYSVEQTHDMISWSLLTNCIADRTNYSVVAPVVGFTAWRVGVRIQ